MSLRNNWEHFERVRITVTLFCKLQISDKVVCSQPVSMKKLSVTITKEHNSKANSSHHTDLQVRIIELDFFWIKEDLVHTYKFVSKVIFSICFHT